MNLRPITLREARAFVSAHHRHHKAPQGGLFAVAVSEGAGAPLGVAIIGRPVARHLDDGWTAEVTRLCTDGTKNACSMLYSAAWRAARALGYRKLITYILASENGASLKASGWKCVGKTKEEGWDRLERPRRDEHPLQAKLRWEAA